MHGVQVWFRYIDVVGGHAVQYVELMLQFKQFGSQTVQLVPDENQPVALQLMHVPEVTEVAL